MSTITATVSGELTLTQFRALGGIAVWTVDSYQPFGQFHDPVADFQPTTLEPVNLFTVLDLPGGIRTFTLTLAALGADPCGKHQFDVGTEGLDLRSLLLKADESCGGRFYQHDTPTSQPVPEPASLLTAALLLWLVTRRFRIRRAA